jgi:hypothetical protein
MKKEFFQGDAKVEATITMEEHDMRPMVEDTIYHCHANCTFTVPNERFQPIVFVGDAWDHNKNNALCNVLNLVTSILSVKEEQYRAYSKQIEEAEDRRKKAQLLRVHEGIARV